MARRRGRHASPTRARALWMSLGVPFGSDAGSTLWVSKGRSVWRGALERPNVRSECRPEPRSTWVCSRLGVRCDVVPWNGSGPSTYGCLRPDRRRWRTNVSVPLRTLSSHTSRRGPPSTPIRLPNRADTTDPSQGARGPKRRGPGVHRQRQALHPRVLQKDCRLQGHGEDRRTERPDGEVLDIRSRGRHPGGVVGGGCVLARRQSRRLTRLKKRCGSWAPSSDLSLRRRCGWMWCSASLSISDVNRRVLC